MYANVIAQFADDSVHGRTRRIHSDGTQPRDFTYIDGVVRGIELAADHRLNGIYNLETSEPHKFNEVIERIVAELRPETSRWAPPESRVNGRPTIRPYTVGL
jgi:UDP-glucose 4-epimerase